MKHLPNLLTLCNLFFGCIAIVFILDSQPFQVEISGSYYYVTGTEQAYLASLFILLAAVCDMLDGYASRALQIFSPIGKDLDSLADVISFGVAPAMILFKMLWASWMLEDNALDIPMLAMAPAFLLACFAALRLAKFNITPSAGSSFTGMPVPAVGLFVASFPLINFYNPFGMGALLQGKWVLYLVIALLCWLMVSRIRFFKLIPAQWKWAHAWPQAVILLAVIILAPFLRIAVVPIAFALYILLSLVYRHPEVSIGRNDAA